MKIVMIHGQNHEGSTCMVARELAKKVGGEIQEFFLPRDFDRPCRGCYTCFQKDLSGCPHYQELAPMEKAVLDADLLILDSPVYVYHATGQMMSFLDHFGTWWVVHRPRPEEIPKRILRNIHRETDKLAHQIQKHAGRRGYNRRAKKWFYLMRFAHMHFPPTEPDYGYWEERGWHGKNRPWR